MIEIIYTANIYMRDQLYVTHLFTDQAQPSLTLTTVETRCNIIYFSQQVTQSCAQTQRSMV